MTKIYDIDKSRFRGQQAAGKGFNLWSLIQSQGNSNNFDEGWRQNASFWIGNIDDECESD